MKLNHTPPYCSCSCHAGAQIFEYIECCPHMGEQWSAEWAEQKKVQDLVPPVLIPLIQYLDPQKLVEELGKDTPAKTIATIRKVFMNQLAQDILAATEIEQAWDKNNRYNEAMETVKDEVPKV